MFFASPGIEVQTHFSSVDCDCDDCDFHGYDQLFHKQRMGRGQQSSESHSADVEPSYLVGLTAMCIHVFVHDKSDL